MTREEVEKIVGEVLREIMEAQNIVIESGNITGDLPLIGKASALDSMSFVMVTAGIEQRLSERQNLAITLVNEKAMSMRNSPFRTVGSLADYVLTLTREASVPTQKA